MNGFFGKVLIIDLSNRTFREEGVEDEVYRRFLGGKGLGSWLLLRHNPPGADPLSPENCLIFATGPLTDTRVFGSARYGVFTRSPQTGIYLESYSGGSVAEPMSRTGYDAVVLKGACDSPTVLEITEADVRFHDGIPFWGMETYATEDAIRNALAPPRAGVAVIGPAGEALVRFAIIANDYWRCCGRGGAGAVLGAKKVKGVFFHGTRRRTVADAGLLEQFYREMLEKSKTNAGVAAYRRWGTPMVVAMTNAAGAFPTRYWSQGSLPAWREISAEALARDCVVRPKACPRCFMACGRLSEVKEGRHAGLRLEGPEYETINAFGGICMVEDIREILHLNDICDRLGIDTISGGNLAGFAIEASHRKDLGFHLDYGDVDGIASLLRAISSREGLGAMLAEGIVPAARAWGLEDLAVHTKGMEPPGYDPRALKGMGLAYATSDRGACHLRSTFYKPELAGLIASDAVEGKAEMFTEWEDRLTLQDTLILCRFFRDLYVWDEYRILLEGSTGLCVDKATLRSIAGRVLDLAHAFNAREGLRLEDDVLPQRLHDEALHDNGKTLPRAELARMVAEYQALRGWTRAT